MARRSSTICSYGISSIDPALVRPSYGGAEFKDQNFNWRHNGAIETIPHAPVHNYVGTDYDPETKMPIGPVGFMSDLLTASRDPIFWLHHCNIDRVWQMWLDLNPAHKNPGADEWLHSSFTFPTPDPKKTKTWQVGDVLDTTASGLGYVYDTAAAPSAVSAGSPGLQPREVGPEVSAPTPAQPPQLIGAKVGVPIVADRSADIELSPPAVSGRAIIADGERVEPQEWLLSLEGITGTVAAPVYSVYLNVPVGAVPADHPDLLAGMITTFGLPEASRSGGDHDGMGLEFRFRHHPRTRHPRGGRGLGPGHRQCHVRPAGSPATRRPGIRRAARRRAGGAI